MIKIAYKKISEYLVRHEALKIPVGGNPSRVIGLSLGR